MPDIPDDSARLLLFLGHDTGTSLDGGDLMAIGVNCAEFKERYGGIEGETIREIGSAIGKSRTFVRNRLIECGIERRPGGRRPFRREGVRWATDWKRCRKCKTTDRSHQGRGLCSMHYRQWHRAGKPRIWNGLVMIDD